MAHAFRVPSEKPMIGEMSRDLSRWKWVLRSVTGAGLAAGLAMGCGGGGGTPAGAEGGHCFPNNTCDTGLTCASTLCVRLDAGGGGGTTSGSGGASAGSAGAAAGTPGAAGTAGATGAAGASANAGSTGTNDAGTDASDGGNYDASAASDVMLVKRASCPPGPFPKLMLGQAQDVCTAGSGGFTPKYAGTIGPVWVGGQNALYFSNYPPNAVGGTTMGDIVKYTPGGNCEAVFTDVGTEGLAVTPEGRLIGASYKTRTISEFDLGNGHPTPLVTMDMGLPLFFPVDVAVHDNGTIYFTTRSGGINYLVPGVYRVDGAGAITNMAPMNGCCIIMNDTGALALAPGDVALYAGAAAAFDLDATGAPTAIHTNNPVASGAGAGIAVDCAGNIFMSLRSGTGQIIDSTLKVVGTFPGGTDLAFGGPDGMTLFVLHGPAAIAAIPTNIPGMP